MLRVPFRVTPTQATIISFVVMVGFTAVSLVLAIGYPELALLAVVGVLGLAVGFMIFTWPHLGAYLLIITLFTNMSSVFSDQGLPSINKPLVVFVLGSVIINRLVKKRPFPRMRQVELLLLALGIVWLLSAFTATDQYLAIDKVVDFAKDFVIVYTIILTLESHKHWQLGLWLVIISALFLSAMSAYQVLAGDFEQEFFGFAIILREQVLEEVYESRLTGPLGDPNFYGLILVTAVPLAIYHFFDEKKLSLRIVAAVTTLLLVFAIFNTFSRGAFVALVVVMLLIAIERKISPKFLIGGGLVFLLLLPMMPESFSERILSLADLGSSAETAVQEEDSFRGRTSEIISGMMMFAEHPLLGVGVDNYPPNYQIYSSQLGLDSRTSEREAHSLYVETIAETGILGVTVFTALLASLIIGLRRSHRKLQQLNAHPKTQRGLIALQMGLIAFLFASIFLHGAFIRYLWLLIALGAAGIHIVDNLANNKIQLDTK